MIDVKERDLFVINAANFLSAAKIIFERYNCSDDEINMDMTSPLCFLIGHACELALKVRLLDSGCTLKSLIRGKEYNSGHALKKFMEKCEEKEIKFTGSFKHVIITLDQISSNKGNGYKYLKPESKTDGCSHSLQSPSIETALEEVGREIKQLKLKTLQSNDL